DWRYLPPDPANPLSSHHVKKALQLERFKDLIKDPIQHLTTVHKWGDPAFDPTDIFALVPDFFDREASISLGVEAGDPFLRVGSIVLRRDRTGAPGTPPGLVVSLLGRLEADQDLRQPLSDAWEIGAKANLRLQGTISGGI